jgi:hypothetical protein
MGAALAAAAGDNFLDALNLQRRVEQTISDVAAACRMSQRAASEFMERIVGVHGISYDQAAQVLLSQPGAWAELRNRPETVEG